MVLDTFFKERKSLSESDISETVLKYIEIWLTTFTAWSLVKFMLENRLAGLSTFYFICLQIKIITVVKVDVFRSQLT